jgi:metal-responsive CopG/Arc/MetJ family transcriptional regulator
MEVCVDIDAELLGQFDQAARAHNITRNTAVRAKRELIREDEKRKAEDRLEALLLEGLSGDESKLTRKDMSDIRAEAVALVRKKRK